MFQELVLANRDITEVFLASILWDKNPIYMDVVTIMYYVHTLLLIIVINVYIRY